MQIDSVSRPIQRAPETNPPKRARIDPTTNEISLAPAPRVPEPPTPREAQTGRGKNWVFTINNWTQQDLDTIKTAFETKRSGLEYIMYKREICPQTQTKHLQGLACFDKRVYWKTAREVFTRRDGSNNSWLNIMRGTIKQSEEYVSKPETADPTNPNTESYGERPAGKGARSDIAAIAEAIRSGANEAEIFEIDPEYYMHHSTGVRRAIAVSQAKRTFKSKVYWFCGDSGAGKSRLAYEITNGEAYYKNASFEFWENYQNEEFVIIDDYRSAMCPFSEFLRLLDCYPHLVNVKGTHAQFNSKYIIITTPKSPRETWKSQSDENLYQLERRITQIVYFTKGSAPWSQDKNQQFVFDPDEEHIDRQPPTYPIFNPVN